MIRIFITLLVFIWVTSAQAGFFDGVLNKAKEVTEETVKKTVETVSGDDEKEPTKVQEPNQSPQEPVPEMSVEQSVSKADPTDDIQLVTEIQQRLKDLGYKVGVVDGLYGPGTRGAIMQYQKQHGMPADGQPSRELLAKLDAAGASNEIPNTYKNDQQTQASNTQVSIKHNLQLKSGDISIAEISTDRRPSSYRILSLTKLRFDESWLTEENLIQSTESSIDCQQRYRKNSFYGVKHNGCIGELLHHVGENKLRLAPVFSDTEIEGRNPKFAARELKNRQKAALISLSNHLPPEFGDTVRWRGVYDFGKSVLTFNMRGFEEARGSIPNRLPKDIKHLDIRKTESRRNYDPSAGEFYPLKVAPGYIGGITAIAFDRDLSKGELKTPPSKAESLMSKNKDYIGGYAVVEYEVTGVAGEAALARLEKVLIISVGDDPKDIRSAKPVLTLPADAFPKIEAPKQVSQAKPKQKPEPPKKEVAASQAETINLSPLYRISQGKPYGPDLVGLRLGMTIQEAERAINKHKKPRDVMDGKPTKPFKSLKAYLLEPGDETITLATIDSPTGERVAALLRYVWFDPETVPSQTAIAASLEKKYGKTSYTYEVKNRFTRHWDTDWQGRYVNRDERYQKKIGKCERGAGIRSNKGFEKPDGNPYIWYLPWFSERPVGSFWAVETGDLNRIGEHFNRCGTTLEVKYGSGSGGLFGPTLTFLLFDGPWIMDAVKNTEAREKAKGAEGLEL